MTEANTLFLRLEGPLQSWGDTSKFVIRRSMDAPTKSGVLGLLCCAMGLSRPAVSREPIEDAELRQLGEKLIEQDPPHTVLQLLNTMTMGVRIDRPGTRWWDYHTVGAGIGMLTAEGRVKTGAKGTLISRREYLCDASFLVALRGDEKLIQCVRSALENPKWPLYLGRRSCPPSLPVLAKAREGENWTNRGVYTNHRDALSKVPWHPRTEHETPRRDGQRAKTISLDCLVEWQPHDGETAPSDAEVWYDTPLTFDLLAHDSKDARLVIRERIDAQVGQPLQYHTPSPPRPRADYRNEEYKKKREERLKNDEGLCVFCKTPATTVQHVTYRNAGGKEDLGDLRSLCRLCHDAVTMIEYGVGMGLDRIDPTDARWRDEIIQKRDEIRRWRSEEGRRRALRGAPAKVRQELLEEHEE
ncbi:MAG TPA: type I-E CRISPR-associated protein Cas5/CasD [Planctomycetota bacterium]|nr:type I-E CRISPR-associated protein Cas5/CasD [Planctomycetota bacterium]